MSVLHKNKPILLGNSAFDEIIEDDLLFIDKTLFIKEFMEDGCTVSCILRPRRFGKSTNLSMLRSFLSLGAQPASFNRYLIHEHPDFVARHCGTYPVIALNFKDCKGETWEQMYEEIWSCIREMVERHKEDLMHILSIQGNVKFDFIFNQRLSYRFHSGKVISSRILPKHKNVSIVSQRDDDYPNIVR